MERPFWGHGNSGKSVEVNIRKMQTLSGLDSYGLYLANQGHTWRMKERKAFERRVREFKRG